jgi:hypothetical protein
MEVKGGSRTEEIYEWYYQIYLRWNEKNKKQMYSLNRSISGGKGWFFNDDRVIQKYTGPHPKILDSHPYRRIKDIRRVKVKKHD